MADFDARVQVVVDAKKALRELERVEKKARELSQSEIKIKEAATNTQAGKRDVSDAKRKLRNTLALNAALGLYERRLKQIDRITGDLNYRQQNTVSLAKQTRRIASDDLELMQAAATALGRVVEEQNELNRARKKSVALQNKSADFTARIDSLRKKAGSDVKGLQEIKELNATLLNQAKERLDVAEETARQVERELRAKEDSFKNLQASRERKRKQDIEQQKLENKVLKDAQKIYADSLQDLKTSVVKDTNANTMFAKLKEDADEIRKAFTFENQRPRKIWGEFFQAASKERERLLNQRLKDENKLKQAQKRSQERLAEEATKIFDRNQLGKGTAGDRIAEDIKTAQAAMRALGASIKAKRAETSTLAREMAQVKAAAEFEKKALTFRELSYKRLFRDAEKIRQAFPPQQNLSLPALPAAGQSSFKRMQAANEKALAVEKAITEEQKEQQKLQDKKAKRDVERLNTVSNFQRFLREGNEILQKNQALTAKESKGKAATAASSLLPEFDAKSAQALRDYKKAQQEIGTKNVQLIDQSRELFEKQTKRNKLLKAEALIFNSGAALREGDVQTAKELNKQAEKLLATERKRTRAARKRLAKSGIGRRGLGDAAVSGAFPALFGGGLGQSAGGVIGSLIGSKFGLGEMFGIVGSAIGGAIESAVRFAKQLSDALLVSASAMETLNQAGIAFSNTQEKLARQARKEGNFDLANQITDQALQEQIGVDSKTLEGIASPVTLLDNAWKRLTATAGAALGTVFAPFVALLAGALEIVSAVFRAFNQVIGAVATLIRKIPIIGDLIEASNEAVLKSSVEYQKQLNILEQQIEALQRKADLERKVQKALTGPIARSEGSDRAFEELRGLKGGRAAAIRVEEKARKETANQLRQQAVLEEEIRQIRDENPTKTEEQRLKVTEKVLALVDQKGAEGATKAQERATSLANLARATTFNLEDDLQRKREKGLESLQRREEQAREQIEKKALSLRRQQADIFLNTARLIEDTTIKAGKFLLDVATQVSALRRRDAQLAIDTAQQVAKIRGTFLSEEEQNRNNFEAGLKAAVATYKADRAKIEEDSRIALLRARLDELEAVTKIERYREDQAKRIARINEDSINYVAEVTKRLELFSQQTAKAVKDSQLVRIKAVKAELEALEAQNRAFARGFTEQTLVPGVSPEEAQKLAAQANIYKTQADIYEKAQVDVVDTLIQQAEQLKIAFDEIVLPDLPQLTDNTGEATKAQTELENYIQAVRTRIELLTREVGLGEAQKQLLTETTNLYTQQISTFTELNQGMLNRIQNQFQLNELVRQGLTLEEASAEVQRQKALEAANAAIAGATAIINDEDVPRGVKEEFIQLNKELVETVENFEKLRKLESSFGFKLNKRITEVTSELNEMTDAVNVISRTFSELSQNVANGFGEVVTAGFDDLFSSMFGLEKQTKSVQEAFADLFRSIGQQFLSFATDLVQKSLEKFMLQAVADIFKVSLEGIVDDAALIGSNTALTTALGINTAAVKANTLALAVPKLAGGGPAIGGRPHIVGEVGPELFIPSTSGTIVPNNKVKMALEDMAEPRMTGGAVMPGTPYRVGEAGAEMFVPDSPYDVARSSMVSGSKTVVTKEQEKKQEEAYEEMQSSINQDVNVRYESTVINNQSYVTEEQFQSGLKVGMKQARAQTFKQLRNRPAARGKAGI